VKRTAKVTSRKSNSTAKQSSTMTARLALFLSLVNTLLIAAILLTQSDKNNENETSPLPDQSNTATAKLATEDQRNMSSREKVVIPPKQDETEMKAKKSGVAQQKLEPETVPVEEIALIELAPKSARQGLRLQVLNSVKVPQLASKTAEKLIRLAYDVRETGNHKRRLDKTKVISRMKDLSLAYRLAADMGISNEQISYKVAENLVDIDITVILGADYGKINVVRE
jgi:hypothetical protein